MEQFYQWNENDITRGEPHTSFLEISCDQSNLEFLKTNSMRNLHMLWKYLHHLVQKAKESSSSEDPFSFMLPDQFCNLTRSKFMLWRLEESNQSTVQVPYLAMDTEDTPSKTTGGNPTRVPINALLSRKASREKCHNTLFSNMRNILKPSRGTF